MESAQNKCSNQNIRRSLYPYENSAFGHCEFSSWGKKVKASDCSATAFQISFISMLEHLVERIICNGITVGFESEEGKAVIAHTRAAIISIKCMEAHQAERSVRGRRKNAKADIRLNSKLYFKRNFLIADQGK